MARGRMATHRQSGDVAGKREQDEHPAGPAPASTAPPTRRGAAVAPAAQPTFGNPITRESRTTPKRNRPACGSRSASGTRARRSLAQRCCRLPVGAAGARSGRAASVSGRAIVAHPASASVTREQRRAHCSYACNPVARGPCRRAAGVQGGARQAPRRTRRDRARALAARSLAERCTGPGHDGSRADGEWGVAVSACRHDAALLFREVRKSVA
jgi:hypothetical protein